MTFDQTDPWGNVSPWDVANQPQPNPTSEPPVSNQPNAVANPDNVTLSFKGGTGHDASLLVLRAGSLAELDQMLDQQASYLKSVVEKASRVQAFSTNLNAAAKVSSPTTSAPPAQPYFNQSTGQVQNGQSAQPPFGGGAPDHDSQGVTTCAHGPRKHFAKDNWEAMFCQEREKSAQCPPAFKDKKTGKYAVKS
ncbi:MULTISPECIES: hypothetical protein [unclassified Streptomyces]|uniref:hypothetical protein n=1 Tax=unclassified Streptomyces TaxID=2593676 RepID=UPI0012FF2919|nr:MULTISPECIES: hypothetical protein [unclassified Streptomyces]